MCSSLSLSLSILVKGFTRLLRGNLNNHNHNWTELTCGLVLKYS